MRTTVTLDPDVLILIRTAMKERDIPFQQALNDAVRTGLQAKQKRRPFVEIDPLSDRIVGGEEMAERTTDL
ncbi:MAG: hypothetical protein HY820_13055 [Acidobacteria bacterium]|nr:hypothetical protein [Acidobacteriota bacterium]